MKSYLFMKHIFILQLIINRFFFYLKFKKKKMSEKQMLFNDSTERETEVNKIYKEINDFIQVLP